MYYTMVNTDVICPNCGEGHMFREEPKVIKSNTETYVYSCPNCGFVRIAKSNEDLEEEILREQVRADHDVVNHPLHYETGKFESIDVMVETQGIESVQAFCMCNAFKYIYRHKFKNGVEDIRKAKWYIDKYLELEDEK